MAKKSKEVDEDDEFGSLLPYVEDESGLIDSPLARVVDQFKERHFFDVAILDSPDPASVIAAFILTQTGHINAEAEIIVRSDPRLSTALQTNCLPLYSRQLTYPEFLKELINSTSDRVLDPIKKVRLRWFAEHVYAYLGERPTNWDKGRNGIEGRRYANRSLHDLLAANIYLFQQDPVNAYGRCFAALGRWLEMANLSVNYQSPVEVKVPFLKSKDNEPDEIRYGNLTFDRRRILYLVGQAFSFVTIGNSHSGKSTFDESLGLAMRAEILKNQKMGLLGPDDLTVWVEDLDLSSPTLRYIRSRQPKDPRDKRPWNAFLAMRASKNFDAARRRFNLVIGDGPGGNTPDFVTDQVVRGADFAIRVDRSQGRTAESWEEFLLGPNLPTPIIGVHTRINEPGRTSAVRLYRPETDSRRGFLRGRVVDMNLEPKPEDPFVATAAQILLYGLLPDKIRVRQRRAERIRQSLGMD